MKLEMHTTSPLTNKTQLFGSLRESTQDEFKAFFYWLLAGRNSRHDRTTTVWFFNRYRNILFWNHSTIMMSYAISAIRLGSFHPKTNNLVETNWEKSEFFTCCFVFQDIRKGLENFQLCPWSRKRNIMVQTSHLV
jgi:hypothetical protein